MPRHGNHQHAVGLGIGGCHFGDQLVCRDAYGTGDVVTRNHLFANPRPNGARTPPPQQRPGNVHIAFIDRYLFDTIGDPTEHFLENAMRHRAIVAHVDRKENAVRAELLRPGTRHGRINAVLASLVAGCGHHRTVAHADDHRLAAIFRMPRHLQRCVEGVHVDVQHRAASLVVTPVTFGCCDSRCGAHGSMITVFRKILKQMFEYSAAP